MFTTEEILTLAVQLENNAEAHYRQAVTTGNPPLAERLVWLADQEAEHARWFMDLKERSTAATPLLAAVHRVFLRDLMDGQLFSLGAADLSHARDPKALLHTAMEFEQDTILFYEMLRPAITDSAARSKLDAIIAEEREHIRVLEQLELDTVADDAASRAGR